MTKQATMVQRALADPRMLKGGLVRWDHDKQVWSTLFQRATLTTGPRGSLGERTPRPCPQRGRCEQLGVCQGKC